MENVYDENGFNTTTARTEYFPGAMEADKYNIATNILQTYIVPVIIITGFFGNCVSFLVFIASPLKRISTSVYLAALAFSDTGFLVCIGIGWLESLGIRFFHKDGICQITVYCSFVFSFTSIWFVNAFTTEMYIAVFHPKKSSRLCLPRNARRIVGVLSVVACLIYIYAFWIAKVMKMRKSGKEVCVINQEDAKTVMILSVMDTILTLVVPFTMILFMITRLFVHISKFYQSVEFESAAQSTASDTNTENAEGHHGDSVTPGSMNPTVRQASEAYTKLTRMLVVTVVVFLVLNLPSHAIKVQFLFRSSLSENVQFTPTEGFIQIVFQMLYYANFSVNFLLYSVCGRSFRHALMRLSVSFPQRFVQIFRECRKNILKMAKTENLAGSSEQNNDINAQQHSRLVDIHLNEIRFSQLPSIESQFVCKSPPCLIVCESENLIGEEQRVAVN